MWGGERWKQWEKHDHTIVYLLVGHGDARLGQGAGAENLQALEQRGEVDAELCPLDAVVLLEQAVVQAALGLRVLGLPRDDERHRIFRHLSVR